MMSATSKGAVTRVIDTQPLLQGCIDSLLKLRETTPVIYVDLEGVKLSRHGSISIITIYVKRSNIVYLIDVHTLAAACSTTTGTNGITTLKTIFEDRKITKVFFDVRNDSDALYAQYRVLLAGVIDLQLMELVSRKRGKVYVNGLAKCIERDLTGIVAG